MLIFRTLWIFLVLVLEMRGVSSLTLKCRNPGASIGSVRFVGCSKFSCTKKGRRGIWVKSFASSVCCSYQREGFEVGETIRSELADDGCTEVSLVCGEKEGVKNIEMRAVNGCGKPATEESMEKHFDKVQRKLDDILNKTATCVSSSTGTTTSTNTSTVDNVDENKLLFLGPGWPTSELSGSSEVLNLANFTPSTCMPPAYPREVAFGTVGTVWKHRTLLCGGPGHVYLNHGDNTCYLLKMQSDNVGSWTSYPTMLFNRTDAAAAWLGEDWWVTGGQNGDKLQSTEVFSSRDETWSQGVDLPQPVYGHCLLSINATHIFLCGGYTSDGITGATYIYSKSQGFSQQPSMAVVRYGHSCAILGDDVWVVGDENSVEVFSLSTQLWKNGPRMLNAISFGQLLENNGMLYMIGGRYKKDIFQMDKNSTIAWDASNAWKYWNKIGEIQQNRAWFPALKWRTCTYN